MPITAILGTCHPLLTVALALHPDMIIFSQLHQRALLQKFFRGQSSLLQLVDVISPRGLRHAAEFIELLDLPSDSLIQEITTAKQRHIPWGMEAHAILHDSDVTSILKSPQVDMNYLISSNPEVNYVIPLSDPVAAVCHLNEDTHAAMDHYLDTLMWLLDLEARYPKRMMHIFVDRVTTDDICRFEKQASLVADPLYRQHVLAVCQPSPPYTEDCGVRAYFTARARTLSTNTHVSQEVLEHMLELYGCGPVVGSSRLSVAHLPTCTVVY